MKIYLTWSWEFCACRESSRDLFVDFLKPYKDKMYGGTVQYQKKKKTETLQSFLGHGIATILTAFLTQQQL